MFRQILTLVLIVSLMPGLGEILENVEHLLHDGHLAHATSHERDEHTAGHDTLIAEHGCTPVSHICPCHISVPAILPRELMLVQVAGFQVQTRAIVTEQYPVTRANAPPVPPPLA